VGDSRHSTNRYLHPDVTFKHNALAVLRKVYLPELSKFLSLFSFERFYVRLRFRELIVFIYFFLFGQHCFPFQQQQMLPNKIVNLVISRASLQNAHYVHAD